MVCKKTCLFALLTIVLFLGCSLPVSAGVSLVLENDHDYIGNIRMSDGQVIHDRVSFPFRLGNNYASRLNYSINFHLPYPALAPGVSVRVTDAYLVIGNERIEFSYDDGRTDIYFWSRGITSEIVTDYSYGCIYVEFEISCSLTTAQIRDQRTISYSTVEDAYTEKFTGTASTLFSGNVSNTSHYVKNMSSLNSYLVETYTSQYGGLKASTFIGDLKKEVPLRRSSSSRSSSGLIYYDLPGVQLPSVKVQCTNYNIVYGKSNLADSVTDSRTHELLEELIREGGTNADAGTHNRLDAMQQQQQQAAADQLEESKKQTAIAEEQAETTKGIFGKIADFFGSFFDKVIDTVKHLIIPTAEELTAFLQEVNDWFGARLGFVWYPFSLAVDLVSALAQGSADQQLTVPAFRFSVAGTEYTIWEAQTVDLDTLDIFKYVRFFTSALLAAGVVRMAVNKWDEWIGGHVG